MVGRILGIDYGERRLGFAISDLLGITAQGLKTVKINSIKEILSTINEIVKEYNPEKILLGYPLNMNGTKSDKTIDVEKLAEKLKLEYKIEIILWDERWTTKAALRTMKDIGKKIKGNKGEIDRIAVTILLQSYLDTIK